MTPTGVVLALQRALGPALSAAQLAAGALLRPRRMAFLGAVALLPVLIPIAVALVAPDRPLEHSGLRLFESVALHGFLTALAPLAAIYLATPLIGDEIESGTCAFLLTRPVPRSALVVGKFAAYLAIAAATLLPSLLLTWIGCRLTTAEPASLSVSLAFLLPSAAVIVLALAVYGALCCALGAATARPVVYGIVFAFGWERAARLVPGYVDFLTFQRHLEALWPRVTLGGEQLTGGGVEVVSRVAGLTGLQAAAVLTLLAVALLAAATLALRTKEYARAQAVG